mmetsp:Transcript_7785/g.16653  ORF Transcript_7785/g.16653 Transcript_7785/m.16653 type:complete len:156 (-) Transcript_7785:355-822(-)|eukprot:CAMPEP_0171349292 /NCGR_PEP_ID=MMETSP0878-20121228/33335_1 /TAXON_ID=67004 /ORGANISM="Thalassiosira weissflogii, Strain CCMP1336" /LENGTH=155 /DNA_ID=CAMNT_0011853909 /DNA_START=141 /DNA_END=608 /DNA_ORIENTATION=-
MKIYLTFFIPAAVAFVPSRNNAKSTKLSAMSRRDALLAGSGAFLGTLISPNAATAGTANPFMEEEINFEPSQMPRGDKIDINGAFVIDYQQFPGMYPHAAGMIASHGPYKSVADIYKIPGITENDKKVFKKYEKELTALPPGRMFKERINQRQST